MTKTSGQQLLEQRHQEMIDDIQTQLKAISDLINREAQRENYDWADVGDLNYIQEQLQEIVKFHRKL